MTIDPATSRHCLDHAGTTFHFCTAKCCSNFEADPAKCLTSKPEPVAAKLSANYTCPMHPQVRQPGPSNCPICGMTLEPVVVSAEAVPNYELADMTRRS